jgi:hypothetical protein
MSLQTSTEAQQKAEHVEDNQQIEPERHEDCESSNRKKTSTRTDALGTITGSF